MYSTLEHSLYRVEYVLVYRAVLYSSTLLYRTTGVYISTGTVQYYTYISPHLLTWLPFTILS